ncbi:MAG: tRNA-dihydrouridine synthase [Phycisphaerae bacterium]|jgi:nifR3 family TIM-barrel protein|nr:tRNA-dihydrouridine synthase [Phycisphaerae bacterium]
MSDVLKTFRIGEVEIDFPVLLAPLAGYSDLPFRQVCRKLGAPFCATEMMLDRCLLVKPRKPQYISRTDDEDHPIAGQIVGNEPATMAAAAELMDRRGFDVIDLNFACPVRKALRRRRGGHIMSDPQLAIDITRAVITAAPNRPVTLKLRRAFYESDDTHDAFWRIAEGAFDAGAAAICVHGRSVEARYSGPSDWDFLASVKQRFAEKTIVGSGDVMNAPAAMDMFDQTGVDAVSVARGGLGNPWFFRQWCDLRAGRDMYIPTLAEQKEVILDHFRRTVEFYGERRGVKNMRKFGIKYASMHPTPKKLRMAFVAGKDASDWLAVLDNFYS